MNSYTELHVERMLRTMKRLTSEADKRKAAARAAFADGGSLAQLVAAVLEMGDVALVIGSAAALERYRVPPDAARVLLGLIDRGDIEIFECPMDDNKLRVCARPRENWVTWGPPLLGEAPPP